MVRAVRTLLFAISRALRALECDDRNEKEEEEEKALDDSFSEEEEEVEKKKGDDDEKKKKKRKGVEKEEDGDEHKREEITPYNALDSGSLLFEDMWNVRSRAMEEYRPRKLQQTNTVSPTFRILRRLFRRGRRVPRGNA